ncbi:MAG: enoyl-CoA hydratase/isomerase family protein [Phycisphaerales bacterium]|nr:enoyl-CoA hydratase/isomerase family protein [Phycisphaerales bacterium]
MHLATLTFAPPLATLALNRPESRNALSIDLLRAMHDRTGELAARIKSAGDIHIVILTGTGKAFCAGMDLKQVLDVPGAPLTLLSLLSEFTLKLRALPAVTIAVVNGAAIGGGCGLATVCDLAITHADSKMGFPEVDLGVCPAVVAPWLARKVGPGRARSILLRGGLMSGRDAAAAGLVDHVVETREELDPAASALAAKLATGGPGALRATKSLLNDLDGSLDATLARRAAELSAGVLAMPEAQAMLRAKLS